jgi:hypothetical protein
VESSHSAKADGLVLTLLHGRYQERNDSGGHANPLGVGLKHPGPPKEALDTQDFAQDGAAVKLGEALEQRGQQSLKVTVVQLRAANREWAAGVKVLQH